MSRTESAPRIAVGRYAQRVIELVIASMATRVWWDTGKWISLTWRTQDRYNSRPIWAKVLWGKESLRERVHLLYSSLGGFTVKKPPLAERISPPAVNPNKRVDLLGEIRMMFSCRYAKRYSRDTQIGYPFPEGSTPSQCFDWLGQFGRTLLDKHHTENVKKWTKVGSKRSRSHIVTECSCKRKLGPRESR